MGLKNTEKYVSEEMSLAELVKSKVIPWRLKAQKSTQREEVERSMRVCREHLSNFPVENSSHVQHSLGMGRVVLFLNIK